MTPSTNHFCHNHQPKMSFIPEIYGEKVFRTRIRENVKLAECPMHHTEILSYAPESNGAADYVSLAKEILSRLDNDK